MAILRDKPALTDAGNLDNFPGKSTSFLVSSKGTNSTKNVKIRVPLNYLSKFWRTLEMPIIDCEINFILTFIV